MTPRLRSIVPRVLPAALALIVMSACGVKLPPPGTTAPGYADFIFPALPQPADPRDAAFARSHENGWRFLMAGDVSHAEREFQSVLKKSPGFYPADAAMGYVDLARRNYPAALTRFDRVLAAYPSYVSALAGRGQALLAESKTTEALEAFEAALKIDPSLEDLARRVEVLRARAAQENVAAARAAAAAGRLDEAAIAYERAIAASPESGFLVRDLAEVEARQGKTDQALQHFRRAIQLDPSDAASRIRIAEILEAKGDLDAAIAAYTEAYAREPSPDIRRRLTELEARAAYLRLPAEYRALGEQPAITRGDLAALIAIRLEPLLASAPARAVLVTDTRGHWAARWILEATRAGVMDAYDNHTFQPRAAVRRSDLAQAVSRTLKIIAAKEPGLLREWQGRQAKMSDVGVSNLNYADVSLAVSAGILPLTDDGLFQLSRAVSGAEAIDAVTRLERLSRAPR